MSGLRNNRSRPILLSQPSVNEEDLFGSGDEDDCHKQKSEADEVFPSSSNPGLANLITPGTDEVFEPALHPGPADPFTPGTDDVFMRQAECSGQVSGSSDSSSNSNAQAKRDSFKESRGPGNLDDNVIRRSLSLPDIVPKDNEDGNDSVKRRKQNLSDNSPDVVSSSENKSSSSTEPLQSLTSTTENISSLRRTSLGKKNKKASVSFQETNISHEISEEDNENKSQENAERRRENYRSSGYFTGSDKASSVQSQLSQGSVFSGTSDSFNQDTSFNHGAESEYEGVDQVDGHDVKNQWSPCSNESDMITVKSGCYGNKGEPFCDLIPLLSALNVSQSSISADNPPDNKDSHSGSSSSVQIHFSDDSNASIQIPNFDLLIGKTTDKGSNSSTGTSSSETYDSLKHVQKKYCRNRDELDIVSPPAFATCLPPSPCLMSNDTGFPSSITSSRAMESDIPVDQFDIQGCKENITREILSQENISESKKLELIESPITPSPRDYSNLLPQKITSETIEKSARCRDGFCVVKFCSKVREGFIGLDRTLEGQWPYGSSPDVSDLCFGLGRHSTAPCDELKCAVRWCYFLSSEFSDEPRGEFVYCALKRHYDMPVLSMTTFPQHVSSSTCKFFKLSDSYRRDKPVYGETLTTFGDYGNVYMMEDMTVIKKIKFQNYDCDIDNTVYKRFCNRQHKHIVEHIWACMYTDIEEIHVCTAFVRGGTLESLLQSRHLLNSVVVQEYILQILDAVIYLHHKCGIIYLYWTTSNMLFQDPKRRHILLSNLTLSVPSDKEFDVGYTKSSLPPCLIPAELINGDDSLKLTGEADSWGLGCMMIEMLTGKQMWYKERHDSKQNLNRKIKNKEINLQQYIPKKPDAFHNILTKCFKFDCKKRISCEDIQKDLKNWKYD